MSISDVTKTMNVFMPSKINKDFTRSQPSLAGSKVKTFVIN